MNAGSSFEVSASQRQLFLDDAGISETKDLGRILHQPAKKGAVIRPDVRSGETCLQTRGAPILDPADGLYKLTVRYSIYRSADGLHWSRMPIEQHTAAYMLLLDAPDPDPRCRFKGFAVKMDDRGHAGLKPVASPDLETWHELDVPYVPSGDEYNLSYDAVEQQFLATVKHPGPYGRSVWLSTSADFRAWTRPELIFHADELDQELGRVNIARRFANPAFQQPAFNIPATYNVDVYDMGLFRYESLYVGMPTMFHKTGQVPGTWPGFADWDVSEEERRLFQKDGDWSGFHHVQLACSRDLRHWQRLGDRQPFLDLSPLGAGAYDLGCIIGPSFPVVRDNELWFYYTGLKQYGGPAPRRGIERDAGAICLAILRRDGFISLDAGERPGVLITRPFVCPGSSLRVNVDTPRGELRVEALGEHGRVLAASAPVSGDLPEADVHWTEGSFANANGRMVSLRFTLRQARLYSYWLA